MAKGFQKDTVFDYKTTNAMPVFEWLRGVINESFPSAEVVLSLQSAFDFPNRLFHEASVKPGKL